MSFLFVVLAPVLPLSVLYPLLVVIERPPRTY